MTKNSDNKADKLKSKTLTLDVDISKILDEKSKVKKKIEVRGKNRLEKEDNLESEKKKVQTKITEAENSSPVNRQSNHLTSEEKERRAKLASINIKEEHSSVFTPSLSNIKVVDHSENDLDKSHKDIESVEDTDTLKNNQDTVVDNSPPEPLLSVKNHVESEKSNKNKFDSLSKPDKKNKKNTLEEEKKRSWKNSYLSYEENVEEEAEVQPLYKKVQIVKRKDKRKNLTKQKIIRKVGLQGKTSVKELAAKMSEKTSNVLSFIHSLDQSLTIDSMIDIDLAELTVSEFGHHPVVLDSSFIESQYHKHDDDEKDLKSRPPVVAVMGHVDHGKTTLLDTIRKTNVVDREAGSITQSIGAYQVEVSDGSLITFLDTPGHEAFSQIRARGSQATDIVVLVVAADDGIKPQTIEAINHTKAANVPIIVAVNKIDKPEANMMKIKTDLLQHDVVVEDMGGDVLLTEISAKKNIGIDKLLETILLQSTMLDLKTNYSSSGVGIVIEVKQKKGFGYLATVLVERGTFSLGDYFVCGLQGGKIKVMINDKGDRVKEAKPSTPVEISGFNGYISAGDPFIIVQNEAKANELIQYKQSKQLNKDSSFISPFNLDLLTQDVSNIKLFSIILKTDTQGILEAIKTSIAKVKHQEIEIKIIHSGVGDISESDIMLASSSDAVIFGLNVKTNNKAQDLAKKESVVIKSYSVIYHLVDELKSMLSHILDPDFKEDIIGYAEVIEIFNISKIGKIAGSYIKEGVIKRYAYARLLRDGKVIYDGSISKIKRFKDDVKEAKQGYECGISLESYEDLEVGDIIEAYEKTEVRKQID